MTCGHHPEPACRAKDYRLFDSTHPDTHLAARRYCAQCPIVMECLHEALAIATANADVGSMARPPFGTWGGLLWVGGVIQPVDARTAAETVEAIRRERAA